MQRTIRIGQRRVQYWEIRPEGQQTVIMVHGFRGNYRGLIGLGEVFGDWRVIIPDLPGYGESESFTERHTLKRYATFLNDFAVALGISPDAVLGHSFGGSIAIVTAAEYPDLTQRFILVEPVLGAATVTSRLGELYYSVGAKLPERWRRWWIVNRTFNRVTTELLTTVREPVAKQKIIQHERGNLQYANPHVEIDSFLSYYQTPLWEYAETITRPTLVIAGERDRMAPLQDLQRLTGVIPHATITVLPRAGHFVPMEDPRNVAGAAMAWLAQSG